MIQQHKSSICQFCDMKIDKHKKTLYSTELGKRVYVLCEYLGENDAVINVVGL